MPSEDKSNCPEKRAFGAALSQLRQERGLTQEELAFESGYHPKYVSLLERGRYSPSLTTILEFANALEVSGAELVTRVERQLPKKRQRRRDHR